MQVDSVGYQIVLASALALVVLIVARMLVAIVVVVVQLLKETAR